MLTTSTNQTTRGIQTFLLENVHLYSFIYSYTPNIYICRCICFECKRFNTEYMTIICKNLESKAGIGSAQTQRMFSCTGRPLLFYEVRFPEKNHSPCPPQHTETFLFLFQPAQLHIGILFVLVKQMLLDFKACTPDGYFCTLVLISLPVFFFLFFSPEGNHDVIGIELGIV